MDTIAATAPFGVPTGQPSESVGTPIEDDNEFCWDQIEEKDRHYLTAPRRVPDPCAWCGGRRCHSAMCDELHEHWAIRMKFGRYKGKKIQDVPPDYLRWLLKARAVRDEDARKAICRHLGIDEDEYGDE